MKIRHVMPSDYSQVMEIETECFGEEAWTIDELIEYRSMYTVHIMVVVERGTVIGFMVVELLSKQINIINFAVHPKYQRSGIGTAMMAKVKHLLCNDCPIVLVDVTERNLDAHLFFRAMGMTAYATQRDHYCDGSDAYCFRFGELATA